MIAGGADMLSVTEAAVFDTFHADQPTLQWCNRLKRHRHGRFRFNLAA
jgi:hypothetical protein